MARDPHPFLVPPNGFTPDGRVRFPAEEAHHARRVVRLGPGDECRVADGFGGLFRVVLEEETGELVGRILETTREARGGPLAVLGFPVLRQHARADWLIEKVVEVGIDRLVPVEWDRSIKSATAEQQRRWERIAREAMKQSERRWLPEIGPEVAPSDLPRDQRMVLADPDGESSLPDMEGADSVLLLVGPEGGLTDDERRMMIERGCALWSLGPTRLRAETAAVVGSHRLACAARATRARTRPVEGGR
jgi:16S rRNA (uracil1498-N3)-methyltransferase